MKGPDRRTYYDMNLWYEKNKEKGILDWHQHVTRADEKLLLEIKNKLSEIKPSKVLEVGCGGGDFTLSYIEDYFEHHAFEYSSIAIEMALAKENTKSVNFKEGDALKISSYTDGPFDLLKWSNRRQTDLVKMHILKIAEKLKNNSQ